MAEEISTLVMRVTSDGIKDGTKQLKDLTKAAGDAETASKKLGTSVVAQGGANKQTSATATALATATGAVTAATTATAQALRQKAIEQKRDVDLHNMQGRAYAQSQAEAIKMNSALTVNTHGHGSNAAAMRESMVLIHELSQGSYKRFGGSLMVLANQMSVIPAIMEAIGAASRGMQFAILGVIAGVALLTYGVIHGAMELTKFNNALIFTGNAAGVTKDSVEASAKSIAATTGEGVANTRNMLMAMAESGTFSAEVLEHGAGILTTYARLSGESTAEVVKHFAKMQDGAEKFAMEENKRTGAFSAGVIQQIHDLELAGKAHEAQILTIDTLGRHFEEQGAKLNGFGKTMTAIADSAKGAWHWVTTLGNAQTTADKLEIARGILKSAQASKGTWRDSNGASASMIKAQTALIIKLEAEAAGEIAKAKARADATEKNKEGATAQERIQASIKRFRDKHEKEADALKALDRDLAITMANGAKFTEEQIQQAKDDIHERYEKKRAARGTDDSAIKRDTELVNIRDNHKEITNEYEEFIAHSHELANKEHANQREQLAERDMARQGELMNLRQRWNEELTELNKFHGKTAVAIAANEEKKAKARAEYNKSAGMVQKEGSKDEDSVTAKEVAAQDKLMKSIETTGLAETKRLDHQLEADRKRLEGIGVLKSAKVDAETKVVEAENARLENELAILAVEISIGEATGVWSKNQIEAAKDSLALGTQHLAQRKSHLAYLEQEEAALKKVEAADRTTKNLDDAVAAAGRFEKAMTEAFGNTGKAVGGLSVAFFRMAKDRDIAQVKFSKASQEDIKSGKAQKDLDKERFEANISGVGNMLEASKNFFDNQSKGYAVVDGISKAVHAAQLARNLVSTVSGIIAGAAQMFGQSGWGGFAGVAAMGAVMAALGYSVAGASHAGGKSSEQVQKEQGTGGVFGDANAKSDSIGKSIEAMKSNSSLMLPLTSAMLVSLRNIEASMVGLTNLVVRTPGLTNGTNMGIKTGTIDRTFGTNALHAFTTPLLDALVGGGIINGVNKLFSLWGKTTQNIVDSGLQFGGVVSDLQAGKGYSQYASVDTTKSSWFGLSKSTTNSLQTQGLSDELSSQFGLIFSNLEDTLKLAAKGLGKDSEQVGTAISNLVIESTVVSLKGLSGQALTDALNAVISKTMDQIAEAAFPAMDAFRQVGEGYAQTVIRVSSGIEQAQVGLSEFGITAIAYTDITKKSGDVAEQIIHQSIALKEGLSGVGEVMGMLSGSADDLISSYRQLTEARKKMSDMNLGTGLNLGTIRGAGGLDKLTTDLDGYYDKYFSASEKAEIETRNLTAQFASFGNSMPNSREQLRLWIETFSQAGDQDRAGKLLSLAAAFDKLMDSAVNNFGAIDEAFKRLTDSVAAQKKVLDDKYKADMSAAESYHKLVKTGIANRATADRAAIEADKASMARRIAAAQGQNAISAAANKAAIITTNETISSLTALMSSLSSAVEATAQIIDPATAHTNALGVVRTATTSMRTGGGTGDMASLQEAIKTLSTPTESLFGSMVDYQRSQAEANLALTSLKTAGETQLTDAQMQLEALNVIKESIDAMTTYLSNAMTNIGVAAQTQVDLVAKQQADAEDARYTAEQESLTARHADQIARLDKTIELAAAQVDAIKGLNVTMVSVADALRGFSTVINTAASTKSITLPEAPQLPDFSPYPSFAIGTNELPDDMTINAHKGERIIPAADNAEIMRRLRTSDAESGNVENAIIAIKIDQLIETIKIGDTANVQKSNDIYRIFRDWDGNGLPPERVTV